MDVALAGVLDAFEREGIAFTVLSADGAGTYGGYANLFSSYDEVPGITQASYADGILYIGPSESFHPKAVAGGSGFVLFGTAKTDFEALASCDIVIVPKKYSEKARRTIHDLFYASEEIDSYRMLSSHLITVQGVQGIVDLFSSILQNPIIVCDPFYFEWVVFSSGYAADANDLTSILNYRVLPSDYLEVVNDSGIANEFFESSRPIYIESGAYESAPRITQGIAADGKIVGSVSLVESNRPFRETDSAMVHLLSTVLTEEIRKNGIPKDAKRDHRLRSFLTGDLSQLDYLGEWANGSSAEGRYAVRLIVARREHVEPRILNKEVRRVFCQSRSAMSTVIGNAVVLAAVFADQHEEAGFVDHVRSWLEDKGCRAGVSDSILGIAELPAAYEALKAAMELGEKFDPERRVVEFADLSTMCLIHAAAQSADLAPFLMPGLLRLIDYDRENDTSYSETLIAYARCGSRSKAAAELFIHKNTLSYRLERIAELLGLDSIDQISPYRVMLTADMIRYLKAPQKAAAGGSDT